MEMESNLIMKNEKLEASAILRKALKLPAKNINFFIFTTLTSLPLFCFLIYYESLLPKFMVEITKFLNPPNRPHAYWDGYREWNHFNLSWSIPVDLARKLNQKFPYGLAHLGLLYLVPLQLLELLTVLVIVDLASKIYTEERPTMTLKEMLHKPFDKTRLKGNFVTYVSVLVLSTYTLIALTWLGITYYATSVFRKILEGEVFYTLLCWPAFAALLIMYLSWSAVWNVSVVISILEGAHGIKAFGRAIYLSRGSEWRGFVLMLIFFAWEVGIRLPCLYFGCCNETRGDYTAIAAQASLLCIGNVLKWVVIMIYFYDCKNRVLEKKLMMKLKKSGESGC